MNKLRHEMARRFGQEAEVDAESSERGDCYSIHLDSRVSRHQNRILIEARDCIYFSINNGLSDATTTSSRS